MKILAILVCLISVSAVSKADSKPLPPIEIVNPVGGYAFEGANSENLAHQDYLKACNDWKMSARQQLGNSIMYLNCGQEDHVGLRFNDQFASNSRLVFASNLEVIFIGDAVIGDFVKYGPGAPERAAKSHKDKCQAWLKETKQNAGPRLMYAHCGAPLQKGSIGYGYTFASDSVVALAANKTKTFNITASSLVEFGQKCEALRRKARQDFGQSLLIATCGKIQHPKAPGAPYASTGVLVQR